MTFIFSFLDHEIDDNKIADLEGKVNKVRSSKGIRPTVRSSNLALKFSAPSFK